MISLILSTAIRLLLPLLLIFSVFLLLRGHNEPGGGFVGGLVAAAAIVLHALAEGVDKARALVRIEPRLLVGTGLAVSLTSAMMPMALGRPMLTGLWLPWHIPLLGHAGTPILFDLGVYLLVAGMALMIVFALMEEG